MPVYNIVGTGGKMGDGSEDIGDGVVLEKNAMLDGAKNVIINGQCKGKFSPPHTDLLDIDLYPQVYDAVIKALKE